MSTAADITGFSKEEQKEIVAAGEEEILRKAKELSGSEVNKRVSEADTVDMDKTYTLEELAALAEQTAREVDAEVIRW